jgi:Tfp pilus assembly protein PilF
MNRLYFPPPQWLISLCASLLTAVLAACAVPPPAPQVGVTELKERPAENALLAGVRAYEDGQYAQAEQSLNEAAKMGLTAARDRASAQKYLAFIYCTSNRAPQCEQAFRAARSADPQFALTKSEAGHPSWGPVYRRVMGQ